MFAQQQKYKKMPTHPLAQLLALTLLLLSVVNGQQLSMPTNPNKKTFILQNDESMDLSIINPIRIILSTSSALDSDKAHLLKYSQHQGIVTDQENQHTQDISIYYQIMDGTAQFYFGPCQGFTASNIQSVDVEEEFSENNFDKYVRQDLKMAEGTNQISSALLKNSFVKQMREKYMHGQFCIFVIPRRPTKFVIKLGSPSYIVKQIKSKKSQSIVVQKGDTEKKVYFLKIDNEYNIRVQRKSGFPSIYIIQCRRNVSCYQQKTIIPKSQPKGSSDSSQEFVKHSIESMLSKIEQFTGKTCFGCDLYLVMESKQSYKSEIEVSLQPSNYVFQLKQNQILHEQIKAKGVKKYGFDVPKNEKVKFNVQVYEGEIGILIRENKGQWQYQPKQTTGIISIEMPNQNSEHYNISIFALKQKDATYSIVYSSGQNQIYIRDGYPTSQVLKPGQNISLIYINQEVKKSSIYVTLNVNNSQALGSLDLRVFYYEQQQSKQKKQYIYQKQKPKSTTPTALPSEPSPIPQSGQTPVAPVLSKPIEQQPTSSIITIPGEFARIFLQFTYNYTEAVEFSITINDEEIVFLPINHALPIQVDKNSSVSLLVDNNQQGIIQLTIKKCDESSPNIAYALSPKNFMIGNYDYQSLDDSQRIFKSNIRVKKGGGLYIHIEGDKFLNSHLFITANYLHPGKKQTQSAPITKGNHGEINYQLITNSKVQIWFKELDCPAERENECKKQVEYRYFWSNSKADLFRVMICPSLYLFDSEVKNTNGHSILKQGYKIQTKPGADGIISLKHPLNDSIIYIGIKALNKKTGEEFIYKDIQVVTISGQLERMPTSYLFISIGISAFLTFLIVAFIRRQARLGYSPVNTADGQKKRKSKLDIVRGQ